LSRDNFGRDGQTLSYIATASRRSKWTVETGVYKILEYLAVADVER